LIATRLNVDDDEWREMMKKKKKKKRRRERKAKAFIIVVGELGDLSRNKIFSFSTLLFSTHFFLFFIESSNHTPTCALTLKVHSHFTTNVKG
jgi:hypothetical protein